MEQLTLRWHGHACFALTCQDFTVVFDPYEDNYVPGFPPLHLSADLVLCSHQHNDHNAAGIVSLRTGHGDLGCPLTPLQRADLLHLDVAMVPVGGYYTIGPEEAKALIDDLQPKVVIPMHYRMGQVGLPAVGEVEDFLSLVDDYVYYPGDTISINRGTRPQIAVLSFQG